MKVLPGLLLFILVPLISKAQMTYRVNDVDMVNSILSLAGNLNLADSSMSNVVLHVGRQLLGKPCMGGVLDKPETEELVIDLNRLDCVTFLENTIALSVIIKQHKSQFEDFCNELKFIRYRNGVMNGYISRLHYFSEWIENNQQKGLLENITRDIGGTPLVKKINFMSQHRTGYPRLKDDSSMIAVKGIEERINSINKYYIPKDKIHLFQTGIRDGDLIAITTSIEGLEVAHVGIAIHVKGVLHMMHASSLNKKVEISELPLCEMVQKKPDWSGIIVSRLREPQATPLSRIDL